MEEQKNGISKKMEWLREIGAKELERSWKYFVWTGQQYVFYSEEYIKDTPLEELKEGYKRTSTILHVNDCVIR